MHVRVHMLKMTGRPATQFNPGRARVLLGRCEASCPAGPSVFLKPRLQGTTDCWRFETTEIRV